VLSFEIFDVQRAISLHRGAKLWDKVRDECHNILELPDDLARDYLYIYYLHCIHVVDQKSRQLLLTRSFKCKITSAAKLMLARARKAMDIR